MDKIIYDSLSKYYHVLEQTGYVASTHTQKLLLLIFYRDFTLKDYRGLLSKDDYHLIEKALDCLWGSSCLIPYPDYLKNGRLHLSQITQMAQRIKTLENTAVVETGDGESADSDFEITIPEEPEYEAVDLGLPSGTLWAKCNVGAQTETDYGNYYMYGKGSTQYNSEDSTYAGTENPLDSSVDTATQVMGEDWHTPTKSQFEELFRNVRSGEWVTINGIFGYKLYGQNGNSIFLPTAGAWSQGSKGAEGVYGIYWSSTPSGSNGAYILEIKEGQLRYNTTSTRNTGLPIRGVKDAV